MKKLFVYVLYLLVVWGGFRYFFKLPDVIEELWVKPVIWLTPLFWWNSVLKKRVLFFEGVVWRSVLWGVVVGLFYWGVLTRFSVFESITWELWGVALATAVVEELAFSGFVLGYMQRYKTWRDEWMVMMLGLMVLVTRLPILFFVYRLETKTLVFVSLFIFASALVNGFIRIRTKNVLGSVVARTALNIVSLV